jgi:hypothetical protein
MVVVEERNSLVFDQLPLMDGFKPVYKWGNEQHLIKQLNLFAQDNKSPYPLIYQTSNQSNQDSVRDSATTDLTLIIACRNLETDLLNENRWAMSYKNILYPLVVNIEKAFNRAGIYNWDGLFTIQEFPNYGNGQENKTVDIWDALLFSTSITVSGKNCINTIKFT